MTNAELMRAAFGRRRVTAQRAAIARAASVMGRAFSVDELAGIVRVADESAGATATVYRAVGAMVDSGFLSRVGEREGSALYAACPDTDHHHHVVCDGCGRIAHTDCPLDEVRATDNVDGFVVTRHEITLYGLCPACAIEGSAARRPGPE